MEYNSGRGQSITSRPLYISHFLSTWNSRAFEFGAILFLATIYPGTLLPMSIYALFRAGVAIVFASTIGRYIDTEDRLKVVRLSIVSQRIAVATACAIFGLLLWKKEILPLSLSIPGFGLLVVLACIEKLGSIMNTVSVERDWVVVLADGDESLLQTMNAQMRRIDLFCKLMAPLAIALLDTWSSTIAVLVTLGVNVVSVCLEYPLIAWVFRKEPSLQCPRSPTTYSENLSMDIEPASSTSFSRPPNFYHKLLYIITPTLASLKDYYNSPVFLPSFALSLLYFTVLSFSGPMITFLLSIHFTSFSIGILRTISTIFELSATFFAPWIMSSIGPVRAGIWFLSWQILSLVCALSMLWLTPTTTSSQSQIPIPTVQTYIFVFLVILSRIPLWSFDLSAQILIQETLPSSQRGSFSTTEASLQNFFEMLTFACTVVFTRPEQFKYPALVSFIAVSVAGAVYAKYVRNRRGHLLHIMDCVTGKSEPGLQSQRRDGLRRGDLQGERSRVEYAPVSVEMDD